MKYPDVDYYIPSIVIIAALVLIALSLTTFILLTRYTVHLEASDAGKIITLSKGDYLSIDLEGNLTTGYTWEALPIDPAILKQSEKPKMKPDSDSIGSGGTINLNFKAIKTGQSKLKLVYHRPWETSVEPLDTFEITVIVK